MVLYSWLRFWKETDSHVLRIMWRVWVSGFFESRWYRNTYPDIPLAMSPLEHYARFGASERRSPGPHFNSSWYLAKYRDVAESGADPLLHYIEFGRYEGR